MQSHFQEFVIWTSAHLSQSCCPPRRDGLMEERWFVVMLRTVHQANSFIKVVSGSEKLLVPKSGIVQTVEKLKSALDISYLNLYIHACIVLFYMHNIHSITKSCICNY